MNRLRLGVNIDHVATIRNARGGQHPDPLRAARMAAEAGADHGCAISAARHAGFDRPAADAGRARRLSR